MGSPITFSGFNNIDFTTVLNALMQQESLPLTALQTKQATINAENGAYGVLATKLAALDSAASALSDSSTVTKYTPSSSDPSAVSVSTGAGALAGRYDVVVSQLARAQVTSASTTSPDADTTTVADAGVLTIGGVAVTISGAVTLQGLANQVNQTAGIGVSASVIQSAPGAFRLVLQSNDTGQANAFGVVNGLTGGSGVSFLDTDGDGIAGNSDADNAVSAKDASLTVNNIAVTSTTNTLTGAIPGATLTLNQQDPAATIAVTVGRDDGDLTSRVSTFISAYNDLVAFSNSQRTAAAGGTAGTLARDPVLSGVLNQLRASLLTGYAGGTYGHLAEIGISLDRTGLLTLDKDTFSSAAAAHPADVARLFTGDANDGAFAAVHSLVAQYTQAGGFVSSAEAQLNDQLTRLSSSISDLQNRLALKRAALQREFTAADTAMAQLNSQSSALSAFGVSLSGSSLSSSAGH